MPIRPIETLLMPPKSQEASIKNVSEINKEASLQLQQEAIYQKEIKHNLQTAVKLEKSRDNEFRYKDKKDKQESKQDQNRKNTKDKKEKEKNESSSKRHIDIRI